MIGGVLIDIGVVGATFLFAWGALQLGGIASTIRAVGIIVAVVMAVILRDPIAELIHSITGKELEFARITSISLVGMSTYGGIEKFLGWVQYRVEEDQDDWFERTGLEDKIFEPLDTPVAASITGAALGFSWALLFVMLLILMPSDNVMTRSALSSFTGKTMISRATAVRWVVDGFPSHAQTLPKGKNGTKIEPIKYLPMKGEVTPKPLADDPEDLLRSLNRIRSNEKAQTLAWNPEIASVAQRHAENLAAAKSLVVNLPGAGSLDAQINSALGTSKDEFEKKPRVLLVWSHAPSNAAKGLINNAKTAKILSDNKWSEAGIGAADAGWFNGNVYVVVLVALKGSSSTNYEGSLSSSGDAAAVVGA